MKILQYIKSLWPFVTKKRYAITTSFLEENYNRREGLYNTTKEVMRNQIDQLRGDLRKTEIQLSRVSTLLRHIRDNHPEAVKFRGAEVIRDIEDGRTYVIASFMSPISITEPLKNGELSQHEVISMRRFAFNLGMSEGCPLEYVMENIVQRVRASVYKEFEGNKTAAFQPV